MKIIAALMTTFMTANIFASTLQTPEEKLKATYPNLQFQDVAPSPIPGIYEIHMSGANLIYYYPEKNYLVIGEIYSSDGESLTTASMVKLGMDSITGLPLDKALVIGPDDGKPIIEFTDPACHFCQKYDQFANKQDNLKRIIFFYTSIHPEESPALVEHIFCSRDKPAALNAIYSGNIPEKLLTCKEGKERTIQHDEISSQFGVQATPTLVIENRPLVGFNQEVVENYLKSKQKEKQQ